MVLNENAMMDVMMKEATATLYAMEHEEIVKDNFDRLYELMIQSFDDEAFLAKLRGLRPGGTVTKGIILKPENDVLCFANKLWFNVKKTSSKYGVWYYLGVGINLKDVYINEGFYKKLWLSRVAVGDMDEIRQKIHSENFKERISKSLAEHVSSTFLDHVLNIMTF